MRDPLLLAAGLLICIAGFAWLALAMDVHWQQVRADASPARSTKRSLRILGGVAIAVSLWLCLAVDHATMASLVWFMTLTASALTVAFTLTWRPRLLGPLVFWIRPAAQRLD
ncbi:MAG TPA: DUF3325 domain-containing protein [Povalibacter sp.]|uniref:DUF3325 domain-containing protein n=1 Tax=Povalibacter sp. TaxID=1962978 RepID=UPI002D06377F|nr:DUF3325 domain-containing protein [Povalibacter sp.]HMN43182.1 DUF3325 domain-containing protein [Povalibacter sp.]